MRRLFLFVIACLLTSIASAFAQPPTPIPTPTPPGYYVVFEHDAIGVDPNFGGRYELNLDAQPPLVVVPVLVSTIPGLLAKGVPPTSYALPFPALTPGAHSFTVAACNFLGCTPSSPPFGVVLIPRTNAPANVRFEVGG